MTTLNPGTKIKDRYTLKEFKGSGSFGEVWLAHDDILDRDIAIKIYLSLDPRGVEEFKSEYVNTIGIAHPNLLTTRHFDIWEQRPFLIMKYCDKGSVANLAGKIEERQLWEFIRDVAKGLDHLHNLPEPIVHQDIKPDNILMDDDNVFRITDFGISKKIRSTMRKLSKRAVGAGATAYMGPERFDEDPTPVKASDIWSLGASIYELATGELPFSGMGGGMQKNGASIQTLPSPWSTNLNLLMKACLSKETWDRPTAEQVATYAECILKGENPSTSIISRQPDNSQSEGQEYNQEENYEDDDVDLEEREKRRKQAKMMLYGVIVIAVIAIAIFLIPQKKTQPVEVPSIEEQISQPKHPKEELAIPEVQTNTAAPAEQTTEQRAKPQQEPSKSAAKKEESKKAQEPKKTETPKEDKASMLRTAINSGDYQTVQRLANQGYAPAYGPLAKYYLKHNEYKAAETYAKKAKAAGYSEGQQVIKTLETLGYYN
ncbi:MAG: protein kinase [Muribaculaceae bacterium]|nr:protein kinase [Muribaculaceae bacterium]